jgi:hypothetical protein
MLRSLLSAVSLRRSSVCLPSRWYTQTEENGRESALKMEETMGDISPQMQWLREGLPITRFRVLDKDGSILPQAEDPGVFSFLH